MVLTPKTWHDRPFPPNSGETPAQYEARLAAYAASNPSDVTPINAAALGDVESRLGAYADSLVLTKADLSAGTVPATQMRPYNPRGNATPNTAYNPWDVVIYRGRRILVTTAFTTSATSPAFISAANYVTLEREGTFSPSDYGSLSATSGSETAVNAAIADAFNRGGGDIEIPIGTWASSAAIVPRLYTGLKGQGRLASHLVIADNTSQSVVKPRLSTGTGDPNSAFVQLRNFGINGRKATQTAGHGIELSTNPLLTAQTGTSLEWFDMHWLLENLAIRSCKQDGLNATGRSAGVAHNVWAQSNDGRGFVPSFDWVISLAEADSNGLAGFYLNNGAQRLVACKAYLNGRLDATAPGYYLGSNCRFASIAGCEAQNNAGPGYVLDGARNCNVHGTADGNGHKTFGTPSAAVELKNAACNNIIHVACTNMPQGGVEIGDQNYALKITGASVGNHIVLTCEGFSPANILGLIDPASDSVAGNTIIINGVDLTQTLATLADVSVTSLANGQVLAYDSASGKFKNTSAGSSSFVAGTFGTGEDGAAVLNGSNTVPWATLAGSTYTMTRDAHCTTLSVSSGITVIPRNCRLFATTSISITGLIDADGNAGTATAGGAATGSIAGTVITSGQAGGAGGTSANGTVGQAGGYGTGNGGTGGAGSSTTGGSGGGAQSVSTYPYRQPHPALIGWVGSITLRGGAGGGGGGGDGTNRGGGGGSGAGVVVLFSPTVTLASGGVIRSRGGTGFTPATGNCGGGGGGSGGLILIYTLSAWTNSGTTQVTGGAAGTGVGTGSAGTAGGNGNVVNTVLQ